MNRNRATGGSSRHTVPEEEAQCWSQAVESLDEFLGLRNDKAAREAPLALNRLIADLPEDNARLPEALNPIRQNLSGALEGMKDQADKELKAINLAIEKIGILLALRASDTAPPDKRIKRGGRASSPIGSTLGTGTPQSSVAGGSTRGSAAPSLGSATVPANSSGSLRTGKVSVNSRGSAVPERLEVGRNVAFKAPPKKDPETGRMEAAQWILAKIKSYEHPNRYKVEDADEDSNTIYTALASTIFPLPPVDSIGPSAQFPDYPQGQRVLAVYPGTTVFYHTTIVDPPKKHGPPMSRTAANAKIERQYRVKFDEDEDNIRNVPAHLVFAPPAGF